MNKIIIWVRSSTDRQTIEDQLKETEEYARQLGYKDEQFIIIGRAGASAYKVSKIYQEEVDKMYNTIINEPVEAVVAWHLNRLARNEVVAMQIKEFLTEHHVQLHVKEPSIKLLRDDGTVDEGAELVFSLFATMSRQQATEFKAKSMRARRRNKEAKIYNGGRIRLGYTLDENKRYVIDPVTSKLILYIFNKYADGNTSLSQLAKEMNELGYTSYTTSTMGQTLKSPEYYDGKKYPPIITEELYKRSQEAAKKNASSAVLESKYNFFLNRIIKCKCGYGYTVSGRDYRCPIASQGKGGEHSHQLIPDVMDGMAWQLARSLEAQWMMKDRKENEAEVKSEIAVREAKIKATDNYTAKTEKRRQRAKECVLEGIITMDEYKAQMLKISEEAKDTESKVNKWKAEIENFKQILEGNTKNNNVVERINEVNTELNSKDEAEMKEIVRKWITRIEVGDDYRMTIYTPQREYKMQMKPRLRGGWKFFTLSGARLIFPRLERGETIKLTYPKGDVNDVLVFASWLEGSLIV